MATSPRPPCDWHRMVQRVRCPLREKQHKPQKQPSLAPRHRHFLHNAAREEAALTRELKSKPSITLSCP
eukprot:gene13125-biopygen16512